MLRLWLGHDGAKEFIEQWHTLLFNHAAPLQGTYLEKTPKVDFVFCARAKAKTTKKC